MLYTIFYLTVDATFMNTVKLVIQKNYYLIYLVLHKIFLEEISSA